MITVGEIIAVVAGVTLIAAMIILYKIGKL